MSLTITCSVLDQPLLPAAVSSMMAEDKIPLNTLSCCRLQSVSYGWFYGITGSYWCASG